jgi:hypothetical protein|tara:strand:- start:450 stop:605 length:156 start_codon:yes stop_codon:yes gene_type:complete
MKIVSFIEMKNSTKEEYLMLDKHEQDYKSMTLEDFTPIIKRIFARKLYSLL